ncbi:MAG: nuclear transport factor 2 family protein [Bacteroidetes bacterium]|nr:nuclear transport factor 2 family protein [Bacteroidota bacterium]
MENDNSNINSNIAGLIRKCFQAYEDKTREVIEEILSDDFVFSSPYDDFINREEYFKRCWPHSADMKKITVEKIFAEGSEAFARYECIMKDGKSFRNTEFFTAENGKIKSVDVYFGRET